jgi:2-polyprenyl-3-methyl-5-hydroxy-6-metoxy-1,4-benzoquinol methylase
MLRGLNCGPFTIITDEVGMSEVNTLAQQEVAVLNQDTEASQRELQGLESTTGFAGYEGHAPEVKVEKGEQAKYLEMWEKPEYRAFAPGEACAPTFLEIAKPRVGSEVLDFGAGTGRGALALAISGLKVHMLDFAGNCLDEDVRNALGPQAHVLKFSECNLVKPIPHHAQYGYCTDVMEHIPPEWVTTVLVNILHSAQHVFFQISCEEDQCGKLIGESLHLTVKPYAWWAERLQKLGAVIHWSEDYKTHCMIYCSAWVQGDEIVEHGELNTTVEQVRKNVETNLTGPWIDIGPHETNDQECIILGGGPSLVEYEDEIKQLHAAGCKVIALNGAGNWCRERGIGPYNQVVVDARTFNARFTHPVDARNLYFIASQCDPEVLEGLPQDRTYLYHVALDTIKDLLEKHRQDIWFHIPGGSTVFLRALLLFRLMGFKKFHVYGVDSCLKRWDGEGEPHTQIHHAYQQDENNNAPVVPVNINGKTFFCHPWMISQAQEFMYLIRNFGNEIMLDVKGNGLLAYIIEAGAEKADEALMKIA